jgi:putative ABC transport system ATP-binding protein
VIDPAGTDRPQGAPDTARPVVELDGVTKIYRMGSTEVRALDGITWAVRPGSFWAIMGPSGSGKSTMLNLLGCLDRPTSGRYLLGGEEVGAFDDDALSEHRLRHLGFIFQSFNLVAQLTVSENIELPLFYQGLSPEECARRSEALAGRVGLADRLTHRPSELSGGQQQRVAIARALANDPSILLADEPTGNLDTATSRQIMDLLCDLHRQGKTIIVVTHESDIAGYAPNRLHMRDGRIERMEVAAP